MTVKHRQLAPTVGPISDDLPMNSMASSNSDNILEKGMLLSFGSWIYIANGSGGFTSHLVDLENMEPHLSDEILAQNNSETQVASQKTLLRTPRRKKILI